MPIRSALRSLGQVDEECPMQTLTSGGVSDTDVNELATSPVGVPSTSAATTVTALGRRANARRSATGVSSVGVSSVGSAIGPGLGRP
jgi:hypothetical protein